jgi:hypothetical protein
VQHDGYETAGKQRTHYGFPIAATIAKLSAVMVRGQGLEQVTDTTAEIALLVTIRCLTLAWISYRRLTHWTVSAIVVAVVVPFGPEPVMDTV